jgi:hypothetical protein
MREDYEDTFASDEEYGHMSEKERKHEDEWRVEQKDLWENRYRPTPVWFMVLTASVIVAFCLLLKYLF